MATRNTNTAILDSQGNNRTATHLSTNIIIMVEGNAVGAVQNLSITESRPGIQMINEVGTDGHIDSAPTGSTNITGSCKRIRWGGARIAEAFSRGFIHVHSMRVPINLVIVDTFSDSNRENALTTVIENVWFKKISYAYDANNFVISDDVDWEAEGIFSFVGQGLNVVNQVSNANHPNGVYINPFEQQADKGTYRGSLDAGNLLNSFLGDGT